MAHHPKKTSKPAQIKMAVSDARGRAGEKYDRAIQQLFDGMEPGARQKSICVEL
jgi:hypothetical protein